MGSGAESEIVRIETDDPAIVAAKADARASLPEFWERLEKPTMFERNFGLKFNLNHDQPDVEEPEIIWTTEVERKKDGRILATLSNVPLTPGYQIGQRVEIPEDAITDWQIERRGKLDGHYSTRVLLAKMPADQAAMIKEQLW